MADNLKVIHLDGLHILNQLHLEETLFKKTTDNWCLINTKTDPAIVMGRIEKIHEVVDQTEAQRQNLPLIRRFSGGGTVVVDENTIFLTFIMQQESTPSDILSWSHSLIAPAFLPSKLMLEGHDFAIHNKKIGGNAQSIKKNRFLQHTSFLWSFEQKRMNTLLFPKKTPAYRENRAHEAFLGRLDQLFSSKHAFVERLLSSLSSFHIEEVSKETLHLLQQQIDKTTTKVEYATATALPEMGF